MAGENDFPNADNYQETSFPEPVPAPDADPDQGSLITVGYNPLWTPVLLAAVDQLRQPGTWDGDNDAKLLAVMRAETLKWLLQQPVDAGTGETVPFWQSDDGSDASNDDPEETWYEQVSWWIITAFLATAVTPGAAIEYVTAVRTLHLAFKRGGFGGLIRALIDGVEVAQIDTYSAGTPVLEWIWDTGDDDEHTLRLELMEDANPAAEIDPDLGGYRMDVIRKNIRFPLPPFVFTTRYNDATDAVETTNDGGETWIENVQADPRHNLLMPLLQSADPRCDAAARMAAYVEELVTGVEDGLAVGALAGTVISLIAGSFALWAGFLSLLWFLFEALATIFIDAGLADLQDSFTSTFYGQLKCFFYVNVNDAGYLSESGLTEVLAQVVALNDVTKSNVFGALVNMLGEGGFNAIASTRTETGNCSTCPTSWAYYERFQTVLLPGTHVGGDMHHNVVALATGVLGADPCSDGYQSVFAQNYPGDGTWRYAQVTFDLGQDKYIQNYQMQYWSTTTGGNRQWRARVQREDGMVTFEQSWAALGGGSGCQPANGLGSANTLNVVGRYLTLAFISAPITTSGVALSQIKINGLV